MNCDQKQLFLLTISTRRDLPKNLSLSVPPPDRNRQEQSLQIAPQHHRAIRGHKQGFLVASHSLDEMRNGAYVIMGQKKEWVAQGDTKCEEEQVSKMLIFAPWVFHL